MFFIKKFLCIYQLPVLLVIGVSFLTDFPTMIDEFVKLLQKQLLPDTEVKPEVEDEINNQFDSIGIPQTKVVVFWDYENFPLPANINESLFFETLFSSGSEERIISKRVYSKLEVIQSRLEVIKKHNFEFIQGLLSRKKNEVDNILMNDCIQFCSKSNEPLLVVLMSGDADYLSLIETLTKDGHEVRLICNSSQKISPSLQTIVPTIIDREKILTGITQLQSNLYTFSSLTNYLLSIGNNNSLEIDALVEEIQRFFITDLNKQISSSFKLLQNSPDYNWQYTITNNVIRKNELVSSSGPSDSIQSRALAHRNGLFFKLGYEEDFDEWEKTWNDYKKFEPNPKNLKDTLHKLYKIVPIPKVRNNIQKELVTMLLYQQNNSSRSSSRNFRAFTSQNPAKPFVCSHCGKAFPIKNSLNQHIRASHRKK